MYLVDEKDVPVGQLGGEHSGQVARAGQHGTGGDFYIDAHFAGEDMGQRGLAQARGGIEKAVVEGFFALAGGLDEDSQVFLNLILSYEFRERSGAQGRVAAQLLAVGFGRKNGLFF